MTTQYEDLADSLTQNAEDWYTLTVRSAHADRYSFELSSEAGAVTVAVQRRFGKTTFESSVNWSSHGSVSPDQAAGYARLIGEAARFADLACAVINAVISGR